MTEPQTARANRATAAADASAAPKPVRTFLQDDATTQQVDEITGEVLTGDPQDQQQQETANPWTATTPTPQEDTPHPVQLPPGFHWGSGPATAETLDEQEETRVLHIIERCDYDQLKRACKTHADTIAASPRLRDAVASRMNEVHPHPDSNADVTISRKRRRSADRKLHGTELGKETLRVHWAEQAQDADRLVELCGAPDFRDWMNKSDRVWQVVTARADRLGVPYIEETNR